MKTENCLCLQCGRAFEMVLPDEVEINDQKCPICGEQNVVRHNAQGFFNSLFGFTGGG